MTLARETSQCGQEILHEALWPSEEGVGDQCDYSSKKVRISCRPGVACLDRLQKQAVVQRRTSVWVTEDKDSSVRAESPGERPAGVLPAALSAAHGCPKAGGRQPPLLGICSQNNETPEMVLKTGRSKCSREMPSKNQTRPKGSECAPLLLHARWGPRGSQTCLI